MCKTTGVNISHLYTVEKTHFLTENNTNMGNVRFKECIDACNECASQCEHGATACAHEKIAHAYARCIELERYCADMCRTAAAFMARADEHTINFVYKFCALCAEICIACATECEKHAHMEHCIQCAEACRKCAVECSQMNKATSTQQV